jgi:hypothetical protein
MVSPTNPADTFIRHRLSHEVKWRGMTVMLPRLRIKGLPGAGRDLALMGFVVPKEHKRCAKTTEKIGGISGMKSERFLTKIRPRNPSLMVPLYHAGGPPHTPPHSGA